MLFLEFNGPRADISDLDRRGVERHLDQEHIGYRAANERMLPVDGTSIRSSHPRELSGLLANIYLDRQLNLSNTGRRLMLWGTFCLGVHKIKVQVHDIDNLGFLGPDVL